MKKAWAQKIKFLQITQNYYTTLVGILMVRISVTFWFWGSNRQSKSYISIKKNHGPII